MRDQLNLSPEPAAKAYDLPQLTGNRNASRGNLYGMEQVHHSMMISDTKQGKDQKRWELVLNKKNENTESKQKQINDMLMKKFKREKAMQKTLKDKEAIKIYDDEQRAERF